MGQLVTSLATRSYGYNSENEGGVGADLMPCKGDDEKNVSANKVVEDGSKNWESIIDRNQIVEDDDDDSSDGYCSVGNEAGIETASLPLNGVKEKTAIFQSRGSVLHVTIEPDAKKGKGKQDQRSKKIEEISHHKHVAFKRRSRKKKIVEDIITNEAIVEHDACIGTSLLPQKRAKGNLLIFQKKKENVEQDHKNKPIEEVRHHKDVAINKRQSRKKKIVEGIIKNEVIAEDIIKNEVIIKDIIKNEEIVEQNACSGTTMLPQKRGERNLLIFQKEKENVKQDQRNKQEVSNHKDVTINKRSKKKIVEDIIKNEAIVEYGACIETSLLPQKRAKGNLLKDQKGKENVKQNRKNKQIKEVSHKDVAINKRRRKKIVENIIKNDTTFEHNACIRTSLLPQKRVKGNLLIFQKEKENVKQDEGNEQIKKVSHPKNVTINKRMRSRKKVVKDIIKNEAIVEDKIKNEEISEQNACIRTSLAPQKRVDGNLLIFQKEKENVKQDQRNKQIKKVSHPKNVTINKRMRSRKKVVKDIIKNEVIVEDKIKNKEIVERNACIGTSLTPQKRVEGNLLILPKEKDNVKQDQRNKQIKKVSHPTNVTINKRRKSRKKVVKDIIKNEVIVEDKIKNEEIVEQNACIGTSLLPQKRVEGNLLIFQKEKENIKQDQRNKQIKEVSHPTNVTINKRRKSRKKVVKDIIKNEVIVEDKIKNEEIVEQNACIGTSLTPQKRVEGNLLIFQKEKENVKQDQRNKQIKKVSHPTNVTINKRRKSKKKVIKDIIKNEVIVEDKIKNEKIVEQNVCIGTSLTPQKRVEGNLLIFQKEKENVKQDQRNKQINKVNQPTNVTINQRRKSRKKVVKDIIKNEAIVEDKIKNEEIVELNACIGTSLLPQKRVEGNLLIFQSSKGPILPFYIDPAGKKGYGTPLAHQENKQMKNDGHHVDVVIKKNGKKDKIVEDNSKNDGKEVVLKKKGKKNNKIFEDNSKNDDNEIVWLKHYNNKQRILMVGEGDFSFSASLAVSFGSSSSKITATSLNNSAYLRNNYMNASENIEKLTNGGATVMHGIDATKMSNYPYWQGIKFDRIIYNFPYSGCPKTEPRKIQLRQHLELVRGFLTNAKDMLEEGGEIHISHKTNSFHSDWKLEELAWEVGLRLVQEVEFDKSDYPGYETKQGYRGNINFDCYPSSTFMFAPIPHKN